MSERHEGWNEYYERHAERQPRQQLLDALDLMRERHDSFCDLIALDVGAGQMTETKALLEAGLGRVIATDFSEGAERAAAKLELQYNDFSRDIERLSFHRLAHEELANALAPESVDLIVSYYALPFTRTNAFEPLWQSLRAALKPDGILSVNLFGMHDTWAQERMVGGVLQASGMTFHTREELDALCDGMTDVSIIEREYDGSTTAGESKHWHTFDIQAVASSHHS